MTPIAGSPVLKRLGFDKPLDPNNIFTATEFLRAKREGYMKPDFDLDRPKEKMHIDPFRGGDKYSVTKPLVSYSSSKT